MPDPIIYTDPDDVGIKMVNADKFGELGEISAITFHHSAAPRARSKAQAQALHRAFQKDHIGSRDLATSDITGRWTIMDDSTGCVPSSSRGAHTGGHNTGNVGIMVHGSYDHDFSN